MNDRTILKGMIEIYQNEFMCGYMIRMSFELSS